jgi:DNA-binding MurR/RpiR family transcriptional regulator
MRKNPDSARGGATLTSETIGEEVRERLGEMTPAERRVARTLLATYPTAGLESLPQLAEGAGVTGPTVLRFVRKVGFEGYPDFQRSLRREVQARTEGLPSLYKTKGATQADEVLRKSQDAFTRALAATLASSSLEEDLAQVVSLLSDRKRRVWFVGGRFSQLVATYLCLQLRMLRSGCAIVEEAPERRVLDSLEVSRRDVLCLFDYRRYQRDTIAAGKLAAGNGAVVVVFTDPWLSPAVEYGRHVLISHADSASPFDSLLGAFAITELIAAKVVATLGDVGRSRVGELEATHELMRGGSAE